jgi:hypothetical protein
VDLRLRSNEASRPAPPQDRPRYFQNTLLILRPRFVLPTKKEFATLTGRQKRQL